MISCMPDAHNVAGHGVASHGGLSKRVDLKLVSQLEFGSGVVAMQCGPRR